MPQIMTSCLECSRRGRFTLIPRGRSRCDAHGGANFWRKDPRIPPLPNDWGKIRRDYLQRHPRCEVPGCLRLATTVDHRLARAFGGTHGEANLRSLCPSHAAEKDAADRAEGRRRKRGAS